MPRYISALRSRAFTLIELLMVLAIIGILSSILFVWVGRGGNAAKRIECTQNVRQLGMASLLYAAEHKNMLPLGEANADKDNYWHHKIQSFVFSGTSNYSGHDLKKVWMCPSDEAVDGGGDGNEALSYGFNANLKNKRVNQIGKPVAMIGDASGSLGINASSSSTTLAYRHDDAAMIFFVDGHVAPLSRNAHASLTELRRAVFLPD